MFTWVKINNLLHFVIFTHLSLYKITQGRRRLNNVNYIKSFILVCNNSGMLRPGSRVCNSMRRIMEIVKDYGGVANGCQLTEVWPGGQKTSNEG